MSQVFAMGARSHEGRSILALARNRFNENRARMNNEEELLSKQAHALIAGEIESSRLLFDDSYVGRMGRPKVLNKVKINEIMGDDLTNHPGVASLGFISGTEPVMDYIYELNDEEIKGLIDAGLYSNPRFEPVFNKLMKEQTINYEATLTFNSVSAIDDDDKVLPLVVVDANNIVMDLVKDDHLSSDFGQALAVATDIAIELHRDNVHVDLVVEDEYHNEREIYAGEDFLDENLLMDEPSYGLSLDDEDEVVDEELDETIAADYTERVGTEKSVIGEGRRFGETPEDQRIRELKEKARQMSSNSRQSAYSGSIVDNEDEYSI